MITPSKKHSDKTIAAWKETKRRSMDRYIAKRKAKTGEVKRINPVSAQRTQLNIVYGILSRELKPQHLICQCCKKNPASEIHHMAGRRGILLIISRHFKFICRECHHFITDHSDEAKVMGMSLPINSAIQYKFTDRELELIEQYNIRLPNDYI